MAKGRRGYEQAGIHYGSGHATSSMALPSVTASRPEGEEKAAQIKDGTSRSRRETLAALRSVRGVSSADILLLLLLFLAVVRFLRACSRFSPVRVEALAFWCVCWSGFTGAPGTFGGRQNMFGSSTTLGLHYVFVLCVCFSLALIFLSFRHLGIRRVFMKALSRSFCSFFVRHPR